MTFSEQENVFKSLHLRVAVASSAFEQLTIPQQTSMTTWDLVSNFFLNTLLLAKSKDPNCDLHNEHASRQ